MDSKVSTNLPAPMPAVWDNVHSRLSEAWKQRGDEKIPKPPTPLILAGAAFSSANKIRQRWIDLILWANEYDFSVLMSQILPQVSDYDVAESIAGISSSGASWFPVFGEQFHQPKLKPEKTLVMETLNLLKRDWSEIVGAELAEATRAKKFTGKKMRRLVLNVSSRFSPSWGSWYSASCNPRAFTEFRKSINAVISPMGIDHIDFKFGSL